MQSSQITRAEERGSIDMDWLKARHYFSFGSYHNPLKMGFGALRVINDDCIDEGKGFATHPHQNMEIITIPLEGAVVHKDSMGNTGEVKTGEVQVMSAGTGVLHSEFNGSKDIKLKLLQIWIEPDQLKLEPRYEQGEFDFEAANQWVQLVSPIQKNEEGLKVNQNAFINHGRFEKGQAVHYEAKTDSGGLYFLVVEGSVSIDGQMLGARDAIGFSEDKTLSFHLNEDSRVLVFEVPIEA